MSRFQIMDADADADSTIMKVVKMFGLFVAIIPVGLWHLVCTLADKITSWCRSTPADQNKVPPPAGGTNSAANPVLNPPQPHTRVLPCECNPGAFDALFEGAAQARAAINAHLSATANAFIDRSDADQILAARVALARLAPNADEAAQRSALNGIANLPSGDGAQDLQNLIVAALRALPVPSAVPTQTSMPTLPNDVGATNAGAANNFNAEQFAEVVADHEFIFVQLAISATDDIGERRTVIKANITDAPNSDADLDALIEEILRYDYAASAFIDISDVDQILAARIALARLAPNADEAAQRSALNGIANLPLADEAKDSIVAALKALPFSAAVFVGANLSDQQQAALKNNPDDNGHLLMDLQPEEKAAVLAHLQA